MDRRNLVLGMASSAIAAPMAPLAARADDAFPTHSITVFNAFPPGGINDIVARPFVAALEPIFKQAVVIETKAGAGGQIGAQVAAAAKPDGYTLLCHNNGINGYEAVDKLYGRAPKTTRADFIPLARLVADPALVIVNADQPWKTLADLVAAAKAQPGGIVYSSGGLYGASHLPVALLEQATGMPKMRHLPTAGGGPAITALLGKNVQLSTQTISASLQYIRNGKLRALASFAAERSKLLPDVPTLKELGYDLEYALWVGLFAPKATPPAVVATLEAAFAQAAQSETYLSAMANLGVAPDYLDQAAFAKFWDLDTKRSEVAVALIGKQG